MTGNTPRNIAPSVSVRARALAAVALFLSTSSVGVASAADVRLPSQSGDTLVVGISAPLTTLRPVGLQQTSMTYNKNDLRALGFSQGRRGPYYRTVAQSWTLSANRLTLTLHLQPGVKFTNGQPFTSAAVLANLKYGATAANAMDSDLTLANCKFSAPNANTVVINMPTAEENALLNSLVTLPMVDQSSNLDSDPIGTGPYMVASFIPNVELNLVRNPHYWNRSGRANIANVDLKVFENAASEVAALEAGAIGVLVPTLKPSSKAPCEWLWDRCFSRYRQRRLFRECQGEGLAVRQSEFP